MSHNYNYNLITRKLSVIWQLNAIINSFISLFYTFYFVLIDKNNHRSFWLHDQFTIQTNSQKNKKRTVCVLDEMQVIESIKYSYSLN